MPFPRSKNKTHNIIIETLELEEEIGRLLLKVDENKKKIQKYFDENGIAQLEIPVISNNISNKILCKKTERATVKYDVDKLREKLDEELFLEVTKRQYTITNIDEMIKLMKDAGVKAKDFKSLIDVKITADTQAIKRLYDVGEISMNQLKGTYTATISKVIKISEETGDKN